MAVTTSVPILIGNVFRVVPLLIAVLLALPVAMAGTPNPPSARPQLPSEMTKAAISALEARMTSDLQAYLRRAPRREGQGRIITARAEIHVPSSTIVVDVSQSFLTSLEPWGFGGEAEDAAHELWMVAAEPHRERVDLRGFHLTAEGRALCQIYPEMRNPRDACPARFLDAEPP